MSEFAPEVGSPRDQGVADAPQTYASPAGLKSPSSLLSASTAGKGMDIPAHQESVPAEVSKEHPASPLITPLCPQDLDGEDSQTVIPPGVVTKKPRVSAAISLSFTLGIPHDVEKVVPVDPPPQSSLMKKPISEIPQGANPRETASIDKSSPLVSDAGPNSGTPPLSKAGSGSLFASTPFPQPAPLGSKFAPPPPCIPTAEAERVQSSSLVDLGDHLAFALGSLVAQVLEASRWAEFLHETLRKVEAERESLSVELVRLRSEREKEQVELSELRGQVIDLHADRASALKQLDEKDSKIHSLDALLAKERDEFVRDKGFSLKITTARSAELKESRARIKSMAEEAAAKAKEFEALISEKHSLEEALASFKSQKHWLISEGIPRSFEAIRMSPHT
ncbi:hypothetical protein E3N88_15708 [Mikania micrantha]|uniref:Uncharacterized protein n=1 Tax=Mikania micrantha TaxID=192012 RepID=A0A5N6NXK8_9ASTR|nr:hypothetical protein E3N88_15708 [Mikania micrantha]